MPDAVATQSTPLSQAPAPAPASASLTTGQWAIVLVVALLLWASGVVAVRIGAPAGIFAGGMAVTSLLFGALIGWVTMVAMRRIARLGRGALAPAAAMGTGVAIMCDGLALTFVPEIYTPEARWQVAGAAWILWIGGVGLVAAVLMDRPGR